MDRLEELVAEFVERREAGESLGVAEFVADHPECAAELAQALAHLEVTDALLPRDLEAAPESIGPWRVLGELGRGGMGRVFRVERDGRECALKLLNVATVLSPRARSRMQREAEALRRLDHPGIVRIVDVQTEGDLPYYVMELIDGPSLAELTTAARSAGVELPGKGSEAVRAARLVADLARAVQAAHDAGLVHRDLKPANVLLRDDRPVLCDFGLAGGEPDSSLTATGDVLGTPHYMAPEQARGEPASPASDVYGLGAILYELLTRSRPHEGDTSLRVLARVRASVPAPVADVAPDVPRDIAAIARRALAFAPEHRFASAAELARHLDRFAAGEPLVRAARPMLRQRLAELPPAWNRGAAAIGLALSAAGLLALSLRGPQSVDAAARRAAIERAVDARLHGDDDAARAAGAALESVDPRDTLGRYLARGEVEGGDAFVTALARGDRAAGARDWTRAADAYGEAVTARPTEPLAIAALGAAARRAARLGEAQRELESAVRMLPGCAPLLLELGELHVERKSWAEARVALAEAIAAGADDADTHALLARACYETESFEEALANIDVAIGLVDEPSDSRLRLRATILGRLDRRAESIPIWRELVRRHPRNSSSHFNLAIALDSEHELRDAADAYREVLDLDPGRTDVMACLAWLWSGSDREQCALCRERFAADPALVDFEAASEIALTCLRADRGATNASDVAVTVLVRTDEKAAGLAVVEELVADPGLDDDALLRLSRGRQRLRR